MVTKKTVFVAFAMEDEAIRNMIKGQSLSNRTPFEYIDMSVKEAYESDWKSKVRTRILRSHGVLAIVSKNSLSSSGQKWEIQCAQELRMDVRGIWAYKDDRTVLPGVKTMVWTWESIGLWIDGL